MPTIREEITVNADPEFVWDALRDIGALHTRLVPGFVVDTQLEPDGAARVVTFGNGAVAREPIVAVDDQLRRVVWTVSDSPLQLTHYNGAVEASPDGNGGTRVVWTADLLPAEAVPRVAAMVAEGIAVIKKTLEQSSVSAANG